MLLVHPPVVRATEPPPGIGRLAAALEAAGFRATLLDLNLEGLFRVLDAAPLRLEGAAGARSLPGREPGRGGSALGRRELGAIKRSPAHLESLRDPRSYAVPDRYRRAVSELGIALEALSAGRGARVGLADYEEPGRSPARRADLLAAAEGWRASPYAELFEEALGSALEREPGAVGLSLGYLSQALPAFALLGCLRELGPRLGRRIPLVMGGSLVSSWIGQGLLAPEERFGGLVDLVVGGPGEEAAVAFARAHEAPRAARGGAAGPPACADPCGGASGPAAGLPRALSLPAYPGLDLARYLSPAPVLPLALSSGCPWRRCRFCPERTEAWPYRPRPPAEALRDLAAAADALGGKGLVHFVDSELPPSALSALAARPPGLPWYGFARFGPALADPAACRALAESGCVALQLGLESGDQAVLDAMEKGTRLETIQACLEALAGAGIAAYLYVLLGTPAEDRDAALRTRDFLARNEGRFAYLNLAVFNLPGRSEEAKALPTRPFGEGELSLYLDFEHPRGWDREAVRGFLAREFEGEPAIAAALRATPPVFSSSHAPFFELARRGLLS